MFCSGYSPGIRGIPDPLLPSVYGIKLGLSNLMIVFMLYLYGSLEAFVVSMIRIIVIGFLFGNLFSILFSLAGALASLLVMSAVKKYKAWESSASV